MASREFVECKKTLGFVERVTLYIALVALTLAILSSYLQPFLLQPMNVFNVALLVLAVGFIIHIGFVGYTRRMIRSQPEVIEQIRRRIISLKAEKLAKENKSMSLSELLTQFPASCHPYVRYVLSHEPKEETSA